MSAVVAQLPEHRPAQAIGLDVAGFLPDRGRILVADPDPLLRVVQVRRLGRIVPVAPVALAALASRRQIALLAQIAVSIRIAAVHAARGAAVARLVLAVAIGAGRAALP